MASRQGLCCRHGQRGRSSSLRQQVIPSRAAVPGSGRPSPSWKRTRGWGARRERPGRFQNTTAFYRGENMLLFSLPKEAVPAFLRGEPVTVKDDGVPRELTFDAAADEVRFINDEGPQ